MWRGLFGRRSNRIGISPTEDETREAVPTDGGGGAEVSNGVVVEGTYLSPIVDMREELARPSTVRTRDVDDVTLLGNFASEHPIRRQYGRRDLNRVGFTNIDELMRNIRDPRGREEKEDETERIKELAKRQREKRKALNRVIVQNPDGDYATLGERIFTKK